MIDLKEIIKWSKVVLGLLVIGIVVENSSLFALMDGASIKMALIVCALIIGIKVQMKI